MQRVILFNKPYGVICQFSPHPKHASLADFIPIKNIYPAGRLDTDSEGLLILTDDGRLQHQISHPSHEKTKTYWVQVEGIPSLAALEALRQGVLLNDGLTQPAAVKHIAEPLGLWPRQPPIRFRKTIPDSWLEITLKEGKNRQIRRMTAKIGHPTLRLIRSKIGEWSLAKLLPGEWQPIKNHKNLKPLSTFD